MAIPEKTERRVLFAILGILLIGLIVLFWLIFGQLQQAKGEVGQVELVSVTPTVTSSTNVHVTFDLSSPDESTDLVKDTANKFMQAKEDRSLEEAKSYTTEDLYKKWTQDSFAGAPPAGGSASMDRFEISGVSKKSDDTYQVSVTSYWLLNGQNSQTVKYSIELIKNDSDFLVNTFDQV